MHISISTSTGHIIGPKLFSRFVREIERYKCSYFQCTSNNSEYETETPKHCDFQFSILVSGIVKKRIWMTLSEISWIFSFILIRCRSANAMKNIKCPNYFELAPKLQFKTETVATGGRGVADERFDGNCKWMNLARWQYTKQFMYEWIVVSWRPEYGNRVNWGALETRIRVFSLVVGTWDVGVPTLRCV